MPQFFLEPLERRALLSAAVMLPSIPFNPIRVNPAAGSAVIAPTPPTQFTLTYPIPVDPNSVDPTQFAVNGIQPDSWSLDGTGLQVTFEYNASPITTQGVQTLTASADTALGLDGSNFSPVNETFRWAARLLDGNVTRGARGRVRVWLTNNGAADLTPDQTINVFLSTDANGYRPVRIGQAALGNTIAAGASTDLSVPLNLSGLRPGNYQDLLVTLQPTGRGHGTTFATQPIALVIHSPSTPDHRRRDLGLFD